MKTIGIILALILAIGYGAAIAGQTVMIVHQDNPQSTITKSQIAGLFMGNSTKWTNGSRVLTVDQAKTTEPGKAFLSKVIGMSESDYKKYWVERMLSGQAEPPTVKPSDADVIKYVKENLGAVGYIDAANFKSGDGVKALTIDGNTNW